MAQKYAAEFYKLPTNTIKNIIRRSKKQKSSIEIVKKGWKQELGPRCVWRLLSSVRENNKLLLFVVAARFRTLDGSKLSKRTIQRYLDKNGIHSYVAASKHF